METTKFKKLRTLADIKNDPRVDSIHHEDEGFESDSSWWCYLKSGWQAYGNQQHTIHEETIKQIIDVLEDAEPWPEDTDLIQK
jgi:hypothetical protein